MAGGNSFDQDLAHTYNGDGQRIERQGTPGNARYVRDGNNIALKLDLSNSLIDSYTYELKEYGKLISTGGGLFHLYDNLGSTTALTDGSGDATDEYRYGSWGDVVSLNASPAVDPFLFVGRLGYYNDDEGRTSSATSPLLPMEVGERFLMAAWGRWISPEPWRFDADWLNAALGDPSPAMLIAVLANPYPYVGNNPVNATDPSGLVSPGHDGCDWPPPVIKPKTPQQACSDFLNDPTCTNQNWLKTLPNCPCSLPAVGPAWPNKSTAPSEHPGAAWCVRSPATFPGGPGQQCCYDASMKLITGGAGAGTPDHTAPIGPYVLDHFLEDVAPFISCKTAGMLSTYLKCRPPNNGNNCPPNIK